ncbi:hypothetical protein [Nocardia salmonicida]|uniref:Uncharacterized protein n=1 Tax=Nocardia salmonicida TaxID=53431 RepID=A0ABZ1N1J5_9NOCA|nr:hypothetical protein [Nocardia salmonicida]
MDKFEPGRELLNELSIAARRTGTTLASIVSDAGRKSAREVVDLAHEGRELVAATLRARADELRRRR